MNKKIIYASLFLVGGVAFVKYILPQFKKGKSFTTNPIEYEVEEFYRGKDSNPYGSGRIDKSITPPNKIDRLNQEVGSERVIETIGSGNCENPMCMSYGNSRNKIYL